MTNAVSTERLFLRRFTPDDWLGLYACLSRPEVARFEPYEPYSEEKAKTEAARRAENPDFWAVCLPDGRLIGTIFLSKQPAFETWELGYAFHPDFWGHGYASEAARAMLGEVFGREGAWRVVAMCDPENRASWRLLERLGMRREGHLRRNIWFKRDETGATIWKDTYEYAILREEWNA